MSLTVARTIVDSARTRHWSFGAVEAGDGPALLFINSRLRTHLGQHGAKIEGLIGTTMQYVVPLPTGTLLVTTTGAILATNYGQQIVTNTGTGTPQVTSAYQDGWPIQMSGNIPYVDFSQPPLAADPFGLYGGTPGFALPTDMIRLISVALIYTNNAIIPCDVIPESQRFTTLPGRNPACFLSANRLVPVQPLSTGNTNTRWNNVSAIQISYVGIQTLLTLDDVLNLPAVLVEALIADVAVYFAMQSKTMALNEKMLFRTEADRCASLIANVALDLVNEPEVSMVHYTG